MYAQTRKNTERGHVPSLQIRALGALGFCPTARSSSAGFIALITAIIITVALLVLVLSVGFQGFQTRFTILETDQKEKSAYLAEACVNIAILKLVQDVDYHDTATFPETATVGHETCTINLIDDASGSNRRIEAQGMSGDAYTNLLVEVETLPFPDIVFENWEEVDSF